MMLRTSPAAEPMAETEERATVPATPQAGVPIFTRQYRYVEAITPAPAAFDTAADGIMVSANANVTLTLADDPEGTPHLFPLLAGVQYDLAVAKVTIVSTGTAYALYHRKPAA